MADEPSRHYADPKVIGRISRLEFRARQVVEGFISGTHKSPFHGFSVEFASHREYVPGDEVKHVDWKVWARADRLFIKQYEEETNLRCTLLLDCSRSMAYGESEGDRGMGKFGCAATIAACLAWYVHRQQDAVGLVTFDRDVRARLEPSTNPSHLQALMEKLEGCRPDGNTDVAAVFERLAAEIHRRGVLVLISDLFLPVETLREALSRFRHRRHDTVVIQVLHADELDFAFRDSTLFRGLESADQVMVDPAALRKAYLAEIEGFQARVREACAACGADYLRVRTDEPLDAALAAYLHFRQRTARVSARR